MAQVELLPSGEVRVRVDAPGERAVSERLSQDEAIVLLDQLASLLGYWAQPIKKT